MNYEIKKKGLSIEILAQPPFAFYFYGRLLDRFWYGIRVPASYPLCVFRAPEPEQQL
jgi:hypothetical protein